MIVVVVLDAKTEVIYACHVEPKDTRIRNLNLKLLLELLLELTEKNSLWVDFNIEMKVLKKKGKVLGFYEEP